MFSRSHSKRQHTPVDEYPHPQLHRRQNPNRAELGLDLSISTPRTSTEFFPSTIQTSRLCTASSPISLPRADSIPSIPSTPTHSRTSSNPSSPRPISLFSTPTTPSTLSSQSPTFRNTAASSSSTAAIVDPDLDCPLVLTLTSKYPTGIAADLYMPVDVAMPRRASVVRNLSSRVRPPSAMLNLNLNLNVSLPALHLDFERPRPPTVLQRRMTRTRRESLSEANRFYY